MKGKPKYQKEFEWENWGKINPATIKNAQYKTVLITQFFTTVFISFCLCDLNMVIVQNLLKKNFHRLIKQPVLHHCRHLAIASFIVSTQTKQARSIAFVDGNLHIACAIKQN